MGDEHSTKSICAFDIESQEQRELVNSLARHVLYGEKKKESKQKITKDT